MLLIQAARWRCGARSERLPSCKPASHSNTSLVLRDVCLDPSTQSLSVASLSFMLAYYLHPTSSQPWASLSLITCHSSQKPHSLSYLQRLPAGHFVAYREAGRLMLGLSHGDGTVTHELILFTNNTRSGACKQPCSCCNEGSLLCSCRLDAYSDQPTFEVRTAFNVRF
jgi:hypothetical protein